MKRFPFARQLWLVLLVSCQPPQPVLELSVASLRVDAEATVTVTATNGDMTPGTGTVTLSTTLGMLDSTSLALMEGSGRTKLRCPRSTSGCAANGMIQVTASWPTASGTVTQTVTVRVTDPMPVDGGTRVDAGIDGGLDAGSSDAGSDAGVDAGSFIIAEPDAGTRVPLGFDQGIVMGRLGSPRTVGFSPLFSNDVVSLGFDGMPESAAIHLNRLVYVRNGYAWLWVEDSITSELDGGELDGGELDGGEFDGGELDGGERDGGTPDGGVDGGDAGPSTGPFPLFAPEANDVLFASCTRLVGGEDAGYVRRIIPTPTGGLWVACSGTRTSEIALYRKESIFLSAVVVMEPLAANDTQVFGLVADGGAFILSPTMTLAPALSGRRVSRTAVRATTNGFEAVTFDPNGAGCSLGEFRGDDGVFSEQPLPAAFGFDPECLETSFAGRTDVLLSVVTTDPRGIKATPFTRARDAGIAVDGGRADGGVRDAGVRDAGAPSPADGGLLFTAGPPSDFLSTPPALSVDFTLPVRVVTGP